MNNKLNQNFSLRKLLLSALVAGPLAVLPAPLWALPDTTTANLTQSSGISIVTGVNTINITAPDKAILTWGSFGVAAGETINYLLPAAASSVLNNVTGGALSTISGSLISNGNVYLLNPAGIVLSKTASINTGGFYASTVSEPSSFFSTTGTLNFTGSATQDVVLQADSATAPTIQAVGANNNIVLAGRSVLVEGGTFYGNVKLQATPTVTNGAITAGEIKLAQTSGADAQAGGNVNVNKINGLGGNLTIVSNGAPVSLTGAAVAATPVVTVTADGKLSVAMPVGVATTGSGYAPSTTVPLTITAPLFRQSLNSTTTASTNVGVTAVGTATTDAQGRITGFTLSNVGQGYVSTSAGATGSGVGQNVTAVPAQAGFSTTVTGNTSIDTTSAVANGAVTQTVAGSGRFNSTGTTTITTGSTANTLAAGNLTLGNASLSTLTMPVVGTVNVIEVDGFSVGNSKVLPNTNSGAVTLRAANGNITMASGARVDIVPSVVANNPTISLTANNGGVTYSGNGSLNISTLSTTTASAGIANITATGNITIPAYSNPGLILTTAGGDITTGALSSTQGAANQVAATITASGNVSVGGNINTTGRVAITAGGTLSINNSNTAPATAGAGLNLKSAGDLTFLGNAALSAGTDVVIESTAGSVSIPGGFSGAGSITAANNVSIGAATAARGNAVLALTTTVESSNGTTTTSKFSGGAVSNMGALYTPNSTLPVSFATVNNPGGIAPTGFASTNANGQITGITVTNPGSGITQTNGTVQLLTMTVATPSNDVAIVSGGNLAIKATTGAVTIGAPGAAGNITATGNVSITSASDLQVKSISAANLTLVSTAGAISQVPAPTAPAVLPVASTVIATGTTTLNAATSVTLDNTTNDFNNLVVLNSPSGATIRDTNAVVVANGTDAKGNLTVTSGAGLTATAGALTTINGNNITAATGLATIAGGSITAVPLTVTGSGYTPGAQIPLTFSAPAPTTAAGAVLFSAASTRQDIPGWVIGQVGSTGTSTPAALTSVVVPTPIGSGYAPNTTVPLTINATLAVGGVLPVAEGVVNANGQIASVRVTTPGSGVTAITDIRATNAGTVVPNAATGYLNIGADGRPTGVVVTDGGSGYIFQPTVTGITAPASAPATFTPVFTGNAVTGVAGLVGGAGYVTAPTIAAANGLPAFTTAITNGAITSVIPVATGGIQIGSAATDSVKVAGNLTLTSAGPTGSFVNSLTGLTNSYSVVGTTANTVAVTGTASLNTTGASATFGVIGATGTTPSVNAGSVGGNVGTGSLTIRQDGNLSLAAVTAGSLTATSVSGNISNASGKLAVTGASSFSAATIFAPGTITLSDATSTFGGTITIINGKDVEINSANTALVTTTVAVGSATDNGVVSGGLVVKSPASPVTISVAGTGNLTKVGFSAGGAVSINDGANTDGYTIENATNSGSGTVALNATGPITIGSGVKLSSTGTTTITATGTGSTIKDNGAAASIFGPVVLSSGNGISLTAAGHSFGPVSLTSGTAGANATTSDIVYTEAGTARLNSVVVNSFTPTGGVLTYGSLTVSSTAGSIDQLAAGTITVPAAAIATNGVSFSALTGSVTLANAGNNIAPAVAIAAVGNSSITQSTATPLVLGNVSVSAGTFTATQSSVTQPISQATGSAARIYGATSFQTSGGKITVANTGNNFGGLTLASNNGAQAAGAAIAVTEGGTLNLIGVNTGNGATSSLTLTSENAAIISTATPLANTFITVGGNTSLNAKTDVALNTTQVNNTFTGAITVTAPGNVTIQDGALNTVLAGGTNIGGSLTVRNTNGGNAQIKDTAGALTVFGAVTLGTYNTTGTTVNTNGSINITASTASLGAVKFNSGNVTIAEAQTLNLAAGSTSTGATSLSSGSNIITSGIGGGSFTGTLSLSANGNITITNPIFVSGGLTFRALGTVDLKALSTTGNLNSIAPVNLGAATYVQPSP